MTRRFTGWHMATILVCFFGVVIAVNVVMARFAVGTFGGTVVDNSYIASQRYNQWLQLARAQDALGWRAQAALDAERHVLVRLSDGGAADAVQVRATHVLGQAGAQDLDFVAVGAGRYRSVRPLAPGRWHIRAHVRRGGDVVRVAADLS